MFGVDATARRPLVFAPNVGHPARRARKCIVEMADWQPTRLLLLAALLSCGCSPWLRPPASDKGLPSPLMSQETVVLEVAFVHLTPEDQAVETATWRQLD